MFDVEEALRLINSGKGFLLFYSGKVDLKGNKIKIPWIERWELADHSYNNNSEEQLKVKLNKLLTAFGEAKFEYHIYY